MRAPDQLFDRMTKANTILCCGLDPDLRKLPYDVISHHRRDEDRVWEFAVGVVDAVAPHVCAFKVQKAFFDILPGGHDLLRRLIKYIHSHYPGILVIIDCKIGDIDNTMSTYIDNIFKLLNADGVVVNPYMGDDAIESFAAWGDKLVVVLAKTSNISGGVVQDVALANGNMLWEYMVDLIVNRWNTAGNLAPVISSTADIDLARVRRVIPDNMPVLLAGVGAQGGDLNSLKLLLNSQGLGVFVNSSRNILYVDSSESWRSSVEEAAINLKNILNRVRGL